jgi:cation diffusion facilitator CzcD-associated flavoprotein CzcO
MSSTPTIRAKTPGFLSASITLPFCTRNALPGPGQAGVNNFRVIDHAADFGGTWYWNRYPGVRCDVEAYIYLPYLEETGHVPSEKYTPGSEIHEHLRSVARKFDLYENARFQTQVGRAP